MPGSSNQMGFDFGKGSRPAVSDDISTRCARCRDKVVVPAWCIEQTQLHFCDATCRQAWTEDEPSFEVKFGNPSKRRGANGEIQMRERDSFACQVCGVSEEALGRQFDVHHKIPYRSFPSHLEANKLENLVSVCPSCHAKLEAELRRELPLFKKT